MNKRLLFVDDDVNILSSFKRNLRGKYEITTSPSPVEALELIKTNIKRPFSVIISDLKMPGMTGLEFLTATRSISKDSVRVMLTGYADVDNAISAINEGNIFRFLTKPCAPDQLIKTIDACIEQHRLVVSEKELLRGTLQGSVKLLTEILSLSNSTAFEQSDRIKKIVGGILKHTKIKDAWQIEIAAMLSQVGCFSLPPQVLSKVYGQEELDEAEQRLFDNHPDIGASLVNNIPRLQEVAAIIKYQDKVDDKSITIPIGAKIIHLAKTYDTMIRVGVDVHNALTKLREKTPFYGASLLKALELTVGSTEGYTPRALMIKDLAIGMILDEDVVTIDSLLLMKKEQELAENSITRLLNYGKSCGIKEPVKVLVPNSLLSFK